MAVKCTQCTDSAGGFSKTAAHSIREQREETFFYQINYGVQQAKERKKSAEIKRQEDRSRKNIREINRKK